MEQNNEVKKTHFIKNIIEEHLKTDKYEGRVHTRFPPEPNGYLHIGHAKSICLNFGLAEEYNGKCNLRFDDTNPEKESDEYVNSIQEDIKWLGFDWEDRLFFASDYFDTLYGYAVKLINKGKAYVDDLTGEQIREYRGTLKEPGKNSPYRDRSIVENLDLLERMKAGEFADGEKVLRAKIDMSHPNMNMRDPVIYRIKRFHHHRTGDKWCIYPMYDFTHGQSDSIERITHSLCTLEFENHRPLYDWFVKELEIYAPQQIEFAKLQLTYTMMGKRKLLQMVNEGYVDGWDDPRMPTISGIKRRGYTPAAIRDFADRIGVAKSDNFVDLALLEFSARLDLNKTSQRVLAVLDPIKLTIENYPEGETEMVDAVNNPEDENAGKRQVPFSRNLYIEREDFMEDPPKKFFRLAPGREVRLKYAYIIKCERVIKDEAGNITEIICTYDKDTRSGTGTVNRKVKATLHWVSADHAIEGEVRLYNNLFSKENMNSVDEGKVFTDYINPNSLEIIENAKLEPSLADADPGDRFQFERKGYFCVDTKYSTADKKVFNRTVTLKDTWAKVKKKG